MTQEEKQSLLFKDICAKLPYGLKVNFISIDRISNVIGVVISYRHPRVELDYGPILLLKHIKPYLRPMSSMTEEEKKSYYKTLVYTPEGRPCMFENSFDWLDANHFDYRGLIEKGLALEASEDMYKLD